MQNSLKILIFYKHNANAKLLKYIAVIFWGMGKLIIRIINKRMILLFLLSGLSIHDILMK